MLMVLWRYTTLGSAILTRPQLLLWVLLLSITTPTRPLLLSRLLMLLLRNFAPARQVRTMVTTKGHVTSTVDPRPSLKPPDPFENRGQLRVHAE